MSLQCCSLNEKYDSELAHRFLDFFAKVLTRNVDISLVSADHQFEGLVMRHDRNAEVSIYAYNGHPVDFSPADAPSLLHGTTHAAERHLIFGTREPPDHATDEPVRHQVIRGRHKD